MKARLIYVMGVSGNGKDSLMGYAREKLAKYPNIVLPIAVYHSSRERWR